MTKPKTEVEALAKAKIGKMRVVVDDAHNYNGTGKATISDARSLSAVASDPEGHLVEIQIAALGNGELNVVIAGDFGDRIDPQTGYLIIHAWPTAGRSPEHPLRGRNRPR